MARKPVPRLARFSALGIELAAAVIGCLLAGAWADRHFGTDPWLTLLGIFLGSGLGLRSVLVAAKEAGRED
ncbi:MAG: AtpZ/AtpI family protein [Myxococcota bacterium]